MTIPFVTRLSLAFGSGEAGCAVASHFLRSSASPARIASIACAASPVQRTTQSVQPFQHLWPPTKVFVQLQILGRNLQGVPIPR